MFSRFFFFASWLALTGIAAAAPFTPGNVVVYRVGNGAAGLLNTGAAVFLDEFTAAGAECAAAYCGKWG
jgi:hypothetical protein